MILRGILTAVFSAAALMAQAPRIDAITPGQIPIAGGTEISVRGANLTGAKVTVDKAVLNPISATDSAIRFVGPKHDNGIVTIQVATASGTAYGELYYVPPKLSDLPPGYITTVAGIGQFTGLYRTATQAEISPGPGSPAFDQNGNLYIPEALNERVSRMGPDGILYPFAGNGLANSGDPTVDGEGGPAVDAIVNFPRGVTLDSNRYAYIAEAAPRIRRVDTSTAIITTFAGTGVPGFSGDGGPALKAQLKQVTHITGNGKGTIFFIDYDSATADARIRKITPDGIITTVAGNGVPGFSGDGGPATQAQFNIYQDDRGSLALDPQGNLFVADTGNDRIRRIDGATGVITTFFRTVGTKEQDNAVATDGVGNVYFESDSRILKLSPVGQVLATYGSGPYDLGPPGSPNNAGPTEDGTPLANVRLRPITGMVIDSAGNIVYVEGQFGRVRRLNLTTGVVETLAGIFPRIIGDNGPALASPLGVVDADVAISPTNGMLIGDTVHVAVRQVDSSGIISTIASGYILFAGGALTFNGPAGLQFDGTGNIYMADTGNVYKIDSKGRPQVLVPGFPCEYTGDGGPASAATVCQPWGVALDPMGNFFIADTNNNRIRRVDAATGVITTFAGSGPVNGYEHYAFNGKGSFCGDGGPARQACLNTPLGVAFDPDGNVLIADSWNYRIRKVDQSGNITTFANLTQPPPKQPLGAPSKIAVYGGGNVYTALGSQVLRIAPAGTITAIAGNPDRPGFSGDGGPALQAQMNTLLGVANGGIAIDPDGNVLFIDGQNLRVRAIRFGAVLFPPGAKAVIRGGTPQSAAIGTRFSDTLAVFVSDSVGNPQGNVRVDFDAPESGASCAFSNGHPHVSVLTDRSGVASAPCTANTGSGAFQVTAALLGTTISLKFSLTNTAPRLVSNSIVNGASFANGPVAPGEILTIFGAGVGPQQLAQAAPGADGRYPTLLAGVRVRFNGVDAPVLFARFDQVAVVAPYALDGTTSAQVVVEYSGVASNAITVPVAQSSPAIFSGDSSGRGQAAALNQAGSINSAGNPVDRGSIVVLFGTGAGQTDPPGVDGKLASDPYPKPQQAVTVNIGGQSAEIIYVGAAPTLVAGVLQINARVPTGIAPGPAVPVNVMVGNSSSPQGVTISVR